MVLLTFAESPLAVDLDGEVPTTPIHVCFNIAPGQPGGGPPSGACTEPGSDQTHNVAAALPGDGAYSPLWDVRVYDASGRLVRTLLAGKTRPAGRQGVDWDGRDGSGRTAPSGVYFYRLQAGEDADLGRMLLLK